MSDKWTITIEERMKMQGKQNHIDILENEIDLLASRLETAGTGYLHTTIYTLKERVKELREEISEEEK